MLFQLYILKMLKYHYNTNFKKKNLSKLFLTCKKHLALINNFFELKKRFIGYPHPHDCSGGYNFFPLSIYDIYAVALERHKK